MSVATELENAPFAQIIRNIGVGIAEAQYELDLVSMKIARMMAGYQPEEETGDPPSTTRNTERTLVVDIGDGKAGGYSLLELGFTPTFYQFIDTLIELKMSISVSKETNFSRSSTNINARVSGKLGFFSASSRLSASVVSARYSSKYQYAAEGSSLVRTKLVPVPAPTILEERIREMITASAEE